MKPTVSKLKKKLWVLISKHVRLDYADEGGFNTCYTCGIQKHWTEMQAGHGMSGRGNSILFELDIIRPQCYGCNCCCSGKLDVFTNKLRIELGEKRYEELWKQKQQSRQFKPYELEEMIKKYQKLVKDL